MRFTSKNSPNGLRLENLVVMDWEPTPSKREPRLRRDVKASRGMLIRAMAIKLKNEVQVSAG